MHVRHLFMTRPSLSGLLLVALLFTPLTLTAETAEGPADPVESPAAAQGQTEEGKDGEGSIPRHATNPYHAEPEATEAEKARAERRRYVLVGFSLGTVILAGILVMTVRRGPRKR